MTRKNFVLIVTLLLLPCTVMAAQKMYKWIDAQGNVSYHDRPPAADSGYRVEEKKIETTPSGADAAGDAAQKFPVVLYSIPKCSPCDSARAQLKKRNVPFTEKNVEKDIKLQDELKAKAGALSVPILLVGSKVINGYTDGWLDSELDQAGYPKNETEKSPTAPAAEDEGFKAPIQ